MFKNNKEDEADFCEAYKSQILNNDAEESPSHVGSILIILLLLAMIIALSIFGYNYITNMNSKTSELQTAVESISDDELKVTSEATEPVQKENKIITNKIKDKEVKKTVVKSLNELPKSRSLDVNDLADKIKIDMSKSESDVSKKSKSIEEPIGSLPNHTESKYIEDLAKLTAEIDKERK